MKRGIVVEINDSHGIILKPNGNFVKIKNNGQLYIGQEYEKRGVFEMKKVLVASIALVFALTGVGGYKYTYASPKAYVTLDINPSVQLTTNMYDKVIDVTPLNEDGEIISTNLDLEDMNVNDALKELVGSATENGYIIEGDENAVLVSTTCDDEEKADELLDNAESAINEQLEEDKIENTEIIKENINQERFDEATRLGISPGKMKLLEKLQAELPDVNVDEFATKPVKEIMKTIKDAKKSTNLPDNSDEVTTDNKNTSDELNSSANIENSTVSTSSPESKKDIDNTKTSVLKKEENDKDKDNETSEKNKEEVKQEKTELKPSAENKTSEKTKVENSEKEEHNKDKESKEKFND